MRILYYPEVGNTNYGFPSAEQCEKYENEKRSEYEDFKRRMIENSSYCKLSKLKDELDRSATIPENTIATCSFDSLAIKGMVNVCQRFVDENKHYLQYY